MGNLGTDEGNDCNAGNQGSNRGNRVGMQGIGWECEESWSECGEFGVRIRELMVRIFV